MPHKYRRTAQKNLRCESLYATNIQDLVAKLGELEFGLYTLGVKAVASKGLLVEEFGRLGVQNSVERL